MSGRKSTLIVTTGILIGLLVAGPTAHAAEAQPIRVSSYKGATLEVGDRSGLVIGPSGAAYTVTSSNPDTVEVEQVQTFWVAIARTEGSAEITVSNQAGETGSLTLTVGSAAPQESNAAEVPSPSEVSDVRQELVRLVNEVRRENGVAELTVDQRLMDAAQECSSRKYTDHHNQEECETVAAHGYPHGFGNNLCILTAAAPDDIAQRTVTSWVNSPGHFRAMVDARGDSLWVGVTLDNGTAYCYLFVGMPGTYNPYE